ncbi:MAG: YggS family pyridoxal phosphate-dependent enzyme [Clostridia bacterium]|nr:YggS family pyridoxal phosphate-dependent enzyme [Clostridia bacterium]
MEENAIKNNFEKVKKILDKGNNLGEKITLVGATKFVDEKDIEVAMKCGLTIAGDNKVQEFRDKTSKIKGLTYHFIGRLQTNKVKYLIGNVSLIHSVDSIPLAGEISRLSVKRNVFTDILIEVNAGGEESKAGFTESETENAVEIISKLDGVRVKGLMAMLPADIPDEKKRELCLQMRKLYDIIKEKGYPFEFLSMGMSDDYTTAIECGSNMVRLGTALFGKRDYNLKTSGN